MTSRHNVIMTSTPEVSLGAVVWVNMEQAVLTVLLCGRAESSQGQRYLCDWIYFQQILPQYQGGGKHK